jgi:hypothetical protein
MAHIPAWRATKSRRTYARRNFCVKGILDPGAGSYRDHIFDDNEWSCLKVNAEPMIER